MMWVAHGGKISTLAQPVMFNRICIPLSFAPKTDWSKRYAEAPEIFQYIQDVVQQL